MLCGELKTQSKLLFKLYECNKLLPYKCTFFKSYAHSVFFRSKIQFYIDLTLSCVSPEASSTMRVLAERSLIGTYLYS